MSGSSSSEVSYGLGGGDDGGDVAVTFALAPALVAVDVVARSRVREEYQALPLERKAHCANLATLSKEQAAARRRATRLDARRGCPEPLPDRAAPLADTLAVADSTVAQAALPLLEDGRLPERTTQGAFPQGDNECHPLTHSDFIRVKRQSRCGVKKLARDFAATMSEPGYFRPFLVRPRDVSWRPPSCIHCDPFLAVQLINAMVAWSRRLFTTLAKRAPIHSHDLLFCFHMGEGEPLRWAALVSGAAGVHKVPPRQNWLPHTMICADGGEENVWSSDGRNIRLVASFDEHQPVDSPWVRASPLDGAFCGRLSFYSERGFFEHLVRSQRVHRMISARRVLWRLDPATDDLASIEAVGWDTAVPISAFDPFGGVFSCDPPITADRPLEAEDVASDGEAAVEYGLRADSSGGDGAAEEPSDWLAAELCAVMGAEFWGNLQAQTSSTVQDIDGDVDLDDSEDDEMVATEAPRGESVVEARIPAGVRTPPVATDSLAYRRAAAMRVQELALPAVCELLEVTVNLQWRILDRANGSTLGVIRFVGMHAAQAQCNHKLHRGGTKPCRLLLKC